MKRAWVLVLVVGLVLAAAVGLRVYSHISRPVVALHPEGPGAGAATRPAVPRDYVADPMVDPAERDRGPRRIVSLAPSITEVVWALGLGKRLVGRTPYCHYPPEVEAVPAVGAVTDPNYEKIRSLSPDLVLITANSGLVAAGLERLGLKCLAVPHDRLEDVFAAIERVGQACARPATARHLAEAIRSDLERLRREAAQRVHTPQRVLVVLGDLPVPPRGVWAAGPGSFLDELVRLAGHVNAGRDALNVSHGEIPLARLLAVDPDVILEFRSKVSDEQRRALYGSWAEVGRLRAIEGQRVRCVGSPEWLSAGPRIAIALQRFISVLAEFDDLSPVPDRPGRGGSHQEP